MYLPIHWPSFRGVGQFVNVGTRDDLRVFDGDPTKRTYDNHAGTDLNTCPGHYPWGNVVLNPFPVQAKVLLISDGYPDRESADDVGQSGNKIILGVHESGVPELAAMSRDTERVDMMHAQLGTFLVEQGQIVDPLQPLYMDGYSGWDARHLMHIHMNCYRQGVVVCPFQEQLWMEQDRILACGWGPFHADLTVNSWYEVPAFPGEQQEYVFRCDKPMEALYHVSNPYGQVNQAVSIRYSEDRTVAYILLTHSTGKEKDHQLVKWGYYTFRAKVDGGWSNLVRVNVPFGRLHLEKITA